MKKNIPYIFALLFLFTLIACESKKSDDSVAVAEDQNEKKDSTAKDASEFAVDASKFAVEAADGGLLEVQLGTLALTKAASPQVKKFAQMMVDDHTKANNELKALAGKKNITLPSVMSEDCQKKYYDIDQKRGTEFDKDYMDLMVKDHKDDIDEFEKAAEKSEDPDIKSWAAGTVATLRHHLEEAQRIRDALK